MGTSIHVFVPRYRLVAVPGIALCWGLVVSWIDSRALRLLFATALVAVAACVCFTAASFHHHMYSWKNALAFAEKNASVDNAAVLICSDLPEADYMRMPVGAAIEETGILPPLSYYKLTVPVTPLPRTLNEEAIRAGSVFLQQQSERHEVFLPWRLLSRMALSTGFETRLRETTTFATWVLLTASRCWNSCRAPRRITWAARPYWKMVDRSADGWGYRLTCSLMLPLMEISFHTFLPP